jgi:hypothetical protein
MHELNNAWVDFYETLSAEMIALQMQEGNVTSRSFVQPELKCPFNPGGKI